MIGCLIIHKDHHTSEVLKLIIHDQFIYSDYRVLEEGELFIVIIWNTERRHIWQMALMLEISNIKVGYGFCKLKKGAYKQAMNKFVKRLSYC